MPKRTPIECSPENCGENYPRCGKYSTYNHYRCKCEPCRIAWNTRARKYVAENVDEIRAYQLEWLDANRDRVREQQRDRYAANIESERERNRESANARRAADPDAARQREAEYREKNRAAINQRAGRNAAQPAYRDWMNQYRRATGKGRFYNQNRKAILMAAWIEDVDPIVVFERDGLVCQICGIACLIDAPKYAPYKATLDHIIPLSWGVFRGGFHSYANVQTLCFTCNCRKGNRE